VKHGLEMTERTQNHSPASILLRIDEANEVAQFSASKFNESQVRELNSFEI